MLGGDDLLRIHNAAAAKRRVSDLRHKRGAAAAATLFEVGGDGEFETAGERRGANSGTQKRWQ